MVFSKKRGSAKGSVLWLAAAVIVTAAGFILSSYVFDGHGMKQFPLLLAAASLTGHCRCDVFWGK